ncbi:sensor histidine kinase [Tepidibacter aestuarii]|uniref:sensor histidine kinase n=1 Tax=Tepidibacter aestuarii TaxID=2925782 RepID=UPI0020BFCD5B|nr:GAF domain-containing sensor histidine kinase [Tepidibacter aestuarii]CAH2212150.1 protein of unknown function [Tepidibacter aestuarii]
MNNLNTDSFIDKYILNNFLDKWQKTVDMMAKLYNVPAGLIMKKDEESLEVLISSKTEGNPYNIKDKMKLFSGLYCEEVINTKNILHIKNALEDERWINNPDLKYNMISYLGIPIKWPDGNIFGTICILDTKEREYSSVYKELIYQFKDIIEGDLRNIIYQYEITEKVNELEKNRQAYEKLIEVMPEANILIKDNKIKSANEAAYKLLAIDKKEDIIGTDMLSIIKYCDNINLNEIIKGVEEKGFVRGVQGSITRLDGDKLYLEFSSTFTEFKGEKYILLIMKDITDKIKSDQIKMQLQKEIETDRLRTEFFSNISHELRTPVNIIYSAVQVIERDYNQKHIDKIGKYNKIIKQNCYRLIRVINNLIDITKIDLGCFKSNLNIHNIVNLIEEITFSVSPYIKLNNMNVVFDTEVEEKYIECDTDLIKRIMLNLLSNAIKYGKSDGNIYINIYDKDSKVDISIKDDGIGIAKNKQNTIFDRFIQEDRSFTRKCEGSGIGLSLVKAFVELQGGTITLESEEGIGSEFTISFPNKEFYKEDSIIEKDILITDIIDKANIEFSDIY